MHFEITVDVDAAPETVWALLTDVERWPDMTPSVARVDLLDTPFGEGARARVHQPGLPAAVWTVTDYAENANFTWRSRSPGVTTTGGHELRRTPSGTTSVRLTIDQTGPLAPLAALLLGRRTRTFVTQEANGLKTKAEST